jgi:hypothetical protein
MVLLGKQTRLAALILGLLTFYASYLHMVQMGIDHVLGAFWRDMALVAALMLTYGGPAKAPPPRNPPPSPSGASRGGRNARARWAPRISPSPDPACRTRGEPRARSRPRRRTRDGLISDRCARGLEPAAPGRTIPPP